MVNYTRLAATAKRLIEKNGRDFTLIKQATAPADPAKPWLGADQTLTLVTTATAAGVTGKKGLVVKGLFAAPGSTLGDIFAAIAGELTQRRGTSIYVAAESVSPEDPATYDQVLDGTKALRIEDVETLQPGDIPLLYRLELAQ